MQFGEPPKSYSPVGAGNIGDLLDGLSGSLGFSSESVDSVNGSSLGFASFLGQPPLVVELVLLQKVEDSLLTLALLGFYLFHMNSDGLIV